jgi:hypothetical protein
MGPAKLGQGFLAIVQIVDAASIGRQSARQYPVHLGIGIDQQDRAQTHSRVQHIMKRPKPLNRRDFRR